MYVYLIVPARVTRPAHFALQLIVLVNLTNRDLLRSSAVVNLTHCGLGRNLSMFRNKF